jgi:cell shape-determining protein MreD
MRPALASFLTVVLLWAVVAQANHYLAGAHLYLFVGGLLVAHAALALPLRSGMAVSFLAGIVCDANALIPFGTHALLFASAHAVLFNLRDRLPHDEMAGRVVIALFANLALFLALSFLEIDRSPAPAAAWLRLFADLACSQVFLALIAPWFFMLQTRAIELAEPAPAWR